MIDTDSLAVAIQTKISKDVDEIMRDYIGLQVKQLSLDPDWLDKIENHIRDAIIRLLHKQLKESDVNLKIQAKVDGLSEIIHAHVIDQANKNIESKVRDIVQDLAQDHDWITKMEQQITASVTQKFSRHFNAIDANTLIEDHMDAGLDRYFERTRRSSGMIDRANQLELSIDDGSVTIENVLSANDAQVKNNMAVLGTLDVKNLVVRDTINGDNRSWKKLTDGIVDQAFQKLTVEWRQHMVDEVRKCIQDTGIDIADVTIDGQKLISHGKLATTIKHSNLTSVGTLDTLKVSGDADVNTSLSVRARRVGINTQHPDMALSVWDEEVALVFGKYREQTAYLGTLRPQRLIIGINRSAAVDINEQGRVTINHLTVGRHRICHEPDLPNYSGTKGDIVFNSNPRGDGVWAWQCLGAFRWVPLKSS